MLHETAAIRAYSVYTIQPCTMSHHFMQSHIHRVHECLAVTCHLHFWQNDLEFLHAVAVTWGWIEYMNVDTGKEKSPVGTSSHDLVAF